MIGKPCNWLNEYRISHLIVHNAKRKSDTPKTTMIPGNVQLNLPLECDRIHNDGLPLREDAKPAMGKVIVPEALRR